MQRWILGGIVFVVALIAWILYLYYDTKQFIQNLPELPKQNLDVPPVSVTTTSINLKPDEHVENVLEDILEDPPGAFASSSADTIDPATTSLFFQDAFVKQVPKSDDTGLFPELEMLFLRIRAFEEEILEVIAVLDPIIKEDISIMFRQQEISHELSVVTDSATEQALYEERTELLTREEELAPRIFDLQNEEDEIETKRDSFLERYGISSWQEFKDIYADAYKIWKTQQ